MRITKVLCLFLVVIVFALPLVGCTKPSTSTSGSTGQSASTGTITIAPEKNTGTLTLAINKSEGINPYLSNSNLTYQISNLVFVRMVEISPTMVVVPSALSEVKVNGLTVTLVPNRAYRFKDGTGITSADILACLYAARQSVAYQGQFSNIDTMTDENGVVTITLFNPDSLFAYLLNIPVIKASEVAMPFPTESGRYIYSDDMLVLNDNYNGSKDLLPPEIKLVELSGFNEIVSAMSAGEISAYHTDLETTAVSKTLTWQIPYKLNNLVFLGFNAHRGENSFLANANGRRAISALIDRQLIADKCYYSKAYPAIGAINSFYPCVATKQTINPNAEISSATQLIEEMGYKKGDLSGYYENQQGKRVELELLVYSGSTYKKYAATQLKESFSQNGVYINITETDNFDIYTQKIANGEFDMYIGEVKLYNNMDLSVLLSGGAISGLFYQSDELAGAYAQWRADDQQALQFEQVFEAQMPFAPIVWRTGTLITNKAVHGIVPSISDLFYDINDMVVNEK